jgi:hypothetical protein
MNLQMELECPSLHLPLRDQLIDQKLHQSRRPMMNQSGKGISKSKSKILLRSLTEPKTHTSLIWFLVGYADHSSRVVPNYLSAAELTRMSQTNLKTFSSPNPHARRRFQDFVFLRENLAKDFPACVVPPLPGKHRLGKIAIVSVNFSREPSAVIIS